jgi:Ser/Thr protein kinase RdoA (MazF antagonist)
MALLTALPLDAAKSMLQKYGFELLKIDALSAGSVNSNFFLQVAGESGEPSRSYFARIYEEQGEAGALFELQLNEALFAAGIPVAKPVRLSDGSLHTAHSGKPFAVYERLQGEVICQGRVTPAMTRSVGSSLARVHTAPLGGLKVGPSRFGFDGIEERLARVDASGRSDLAPAVARLREISARLRTVRPQDLPEGLIHGDLLRR